MFLVRECRWPQRILDAATMFEDNTGQCPNCGLASAFQTESHMRIWPGFHTYGVGLGPSTESEWMDLKIVRCLHCSKTVSYRDQFIRMPLENGEPGE